MSATLLEVRGLTKRFGGLVAVAGVDFDLAPGEILGVIGPNGAGKTTMFNLIAGSLAADTGTVRLGSETILGLPPHEIARRGIIRTFQHNRPFESLSLIDNLLVGAHRQMKASLPALLWRSPHAAAEERAQRALAHETLDFVGLRGALSSDVANLSFGQGRLLETARALMAAPRLILFDEPAAGLTPPEIVRLGEIIRKIGASGIAVLVVEHNMDFLLPLAQRVIVLNFGGKIFDGAPLEVRNEPAVIEAYLGTRSVAF
jgi:ABC-type branched-subunit amino acid transport system ATPase component